MTSTKGAKIGLLAGVDAGATKTRVLAVDPATGRMEHAEGPGASAVVHGPAGAAGRVAWLVRRVLKKRPLESLAVGMAGAWPAAASARIKAALKLGLNPRRLTVQNDAAAVLEGLSPEAAAMILSVGTGTFLVSSSSGKTARVDGWGPLAGDSGSGAWIGRRALESALKREDGRDRGRPSPFHRAVLKAAGLFRPEADIGRLYEPGKPFNQLASLAPLVVRFSRRGDRVARRIVAEASAELARTVQAGLDKIPRAGATLYFQGGLASSAPELLRSVKALSRRVPRLELSPLRFAPEAACLRLAARAAGCERSVLHAFNVSFRSRPRVHSPRGGLSDTESLNPSTDLFSSLSVLDQLDLLNREDSLVAPAVRRALPAVARAVRAAESRMKKGGRLVYVGAGTSGRLGILDASEVKPTFGVPDGVVVGVIAGGRTAVQKSVEGAEDDPRAGARAMKRLRIGKEDTVAGLSAGGTAPFVLGALKEARRRGAATVGITSNPGSPLASAARIPIVLRTGPEAISGSTRLKAGTAQKMALNMISTCLMARLGRVSGNLMVRMIPSNLKLRGRALRIKRLLEA